MDLATFLSRACEFFAESGSAYFIAYAAATCLLTQAVKKLFVNKAKVDVFHKFDWARVLPFGFGAGFAALDVFVVRGVRVFDAGTALQLATSALAIGSLATCAFRFVKSLSGQSLSDLMKNDFFGAFYTQLLYFGNVRQRIADKQLDFRDFISQVKLLASDAEIIYRDEGNADAKRCRLAGLLKGIIDDGSIETCVNILNDALMKLTSDK